MNKTSMQSLWDSSLLDGGNLSYLEQKYEEYLKHADKMSPEWKAYFDSIASELGREQEPLHSEIRDYFINLAKKPKLYSIPTEASISKGVVSVEHEQKQLKVLELIHSYRLLGHLKAKIDPLGMKEIPVVNELELNSYGLSQVDFEKEFDTGSLNGPKRLPLKEIINNLEKIYSSSIASEYMHIPNSNERNWVQLRVESDFVNIDLDSDKKQHILERLTAAEGLEKYLASKYPGAKRFGLEGGESLIVAVDEIIQRAGLNKVQEIIIGMAHRGRLNVLVNILGKMPSELFDEFEGKHQKALMSGDVKYHQGFSSNVATSLENIHLSLAFNPSHLEIVSPVVCGAVRAKLERRSNSDLNQIFPILIHGDSAFAGQGVVMETFNMSQTRGYSIGGAVHIVINNQVGFTTSNPNDTRSTLYCSDIGKMMEIPIFHVNADDPEALVKVSQLALDYLLKFNKDVIIDLVCYRRHGHNEADEPSATQPVMYKTIKKLPTCRFKYSKCLTENSIITDEQVKKLEIDYRNTLDERDKHVAKNLVTNGWKSEYTLDWTPYLSSNFNQEVNTGIEINLLKDLATKRDTVPEGFVLHPRVKKIVDDRQKMTSGELPIDWGYAETLAYAGLVKEGYAVRLSGQDCGRGTFFHRHAVWHDQNTADTYISLCNIDKNQKPFWVIDSLLSEAGVLGFEYGYASSDPRKLTIWEAQFGDFANSAQVVIDQFITSGEHKWGRLCGLTMLLPHGYEGQGPEHSSARLERFLQMCAEHNIQVCVPSTPSQVFHMLRRQVIRPLRKPLIVMTPKSLLRHKLAVSTLEDLSTGSFKLVIPEIDEIIPDKVKRVVMCSGKVYYELLEKRRELKKDDTVIIRIEQLYPFPEEELIYEIKKYKNSKELVWCQEEPENQGAWYCTHHHFVRCVQKGQKLSYAGRSASSSPAVGYLSLHNEQQEKLIRDGLGI